MKVAVVPLLFVEIILLVAGQILWKRAATAGWLAALGTVPVWLGLGFYGGATILWTGVLRLLPLSVAYPLQSLSYALGVVASVVLLGERVPMVRWAGVGIIVFGAFLVDVA